MKLLRVSVLCGLILILSIGNVKAQYFEWAVNIGAESPWDEAYDITSDSRGNSYTIGSFQGTVNFGPGPASVTFTQNVNASYVAKHEMETGNLVWAFTLPNGRGYAIDIDQNDNIYVTGSYSGTVDFDPSANVYNLTAPNNQSDMYIAKYTRDGSFIWAKRVGNSSGSNVSPTSIAVNNNGAIAVGGNFKGIADFDPGSGLNNLTSNGLWDCFILKLDANGNFIWAGNIGGPSDDYLTALDFGANNVLAVTGVFAGSADLDPTPIVNTRNSNGNDDIFVVQLSAANTLNWLHTIGSYYRDLAYDLKIDPTDASVVLTGFYQGNCDFDPGPGIQMLSLLGSGSGFVLKLTSSGNYSWVKRFAAVSSFVSGAALDIANTGNMTVGFNFVGSVDLNPGAATVMATAGNSIDIALVELSAVGNYQRAATFVNNTGDENIITVHLNRYNGLYVGGNFNKTNDFDPGSGVANFTAPDQSGVFTRNAFIVYLNLICPTVYTTDVHEACGSFTWIDGATYTSSIVGPDVLYTTASGCDSIVTLDLTIYPAGTGFVDWGNTIGGSNFDRVVDMVVDGAGNTYVTGLITSTVDLDPGAGVSMYTPVGDTDVFVVKYNPLGGFMWGKGFGGSLADVSNGMTVDNSGNVFLTGYFSGTVDFNPGAGTALLSSVGASDMFVLRLDVNGNYVWAKRFGGLSKDVGTAIALSPSNGLVLTGVFDGNVNFGAYTFASVGNYDGAVWMMNTSGTVTGAKHITSKGFCFSNTVTFDAAGQIIVGGRFSGETDFDVDGSSFIVNSTGSFNGNGFVLKLNGFGDFTWLNQLTTDVLTNVLSVDTDASGNIYAGGYFRGTTVFSTIANPLSLSSIGSRDAFVLKLNTSGGCSWVKQLPGASQAIVNDISVNGNGDVWSTGYFSGIVDFNPGTGTDLRTAFGDWDAFAWGLISNGLYLAARQLGRTGYDLGLGIATLNEDVYVGGAMGGYTMTYGPTLVGAPLNGAGNDDGFVVKISTCGTITPTLRESQSAEEFHEEALPDELEIIVYPNPSTDGIFNIQVENRIYDVELFDLMGRKVSISYDLGTSLVDASHLNRGEYILKIKTDAGVFVKKLQLNK